VLCLTAAVLLSGCSDKQVEELIRGKQPEPEKKTIKTLTTTTETTTTATDRKHPTPATQKTTTTYEIPIGQIKLTSSKTEYELNEDVEIKVTNNLHEPAYYLTGVCADNYLILRKENGSFREKRRLRATTCTVASTPLVLPPAASKTIAWNQKYREPGETGLNYFVKAGTYKIGFEYALKSEASKLIEPKFTAYSNEFEVLEEDPAEVLVRSGEHFRGEDIAVTVKSNLDETQYVSSWMQVQKKDGLDWDTVDEVNRFGCPTKLACRHRPQCLEITPMGRLRVLKFSVLRPGIYRAAAKLCMRNKTSQDSELQPKRAIYSREIRIH